MTKLSEKIGYGFGDMSSSMFWKIFSAYLPFFYASVFKLDLISCGTLMLVARIWDAVSDPMMGVIADRNRSRYGVYRPFLLWMSLPFAIAGILLFTVPSDNETVKLVWAYFSYLLMMTVYTAINVPYGSMLGVVTDDSQEKTTFSSFRMFFAYAGSFIVLFSWEPLCNAMASWLGVSNPNEKLTLDPTAWQYSMVVLGVVCALLFVLTFAMTRENVKVDVKKTSVLADLGSLLHNGPWWILLGGVLFFNFCNAIRYAVIPFFFTSLVAMDASIGLMWWQVAFYAGIFLGVGEVANMVGVVLAAPLCKWFGKKTTFIASLMGFALISIAFFYIPLEASGVNYWLMMVAQILICITTGIVSPLVWSMYADVADYAQDKFGTVSTGLIFSSSSMAQKFGGAFGASAVTWILAAFGFTAACTQQTGDALFGVRLLMSWIPAAVAVISILFLLIYPLNTRRMNEIQTKLKNAQ